MERQADSDSAATPGPEAARVSEAGPGKAREDEAQGEKSGEEGGEGITEAEEQELREDGERRLKIAHKFLQAAAFFIATTAKSQELEVLIIVTDRDERPAICMASSLAPEKQPMLLLDALLQVKGGVDELATLARRVMGPDLEEAVKEATKQ